MDLEKAVNIDQQSLICKMISLPCPSSCLCMNGIPSHFLREEIAQHRTVCPMEETACKFAYSGCDVKLPRKNLSFHENDSGFHIDRLHQTLQNAEEKIGKLELEMEKVKTSVEGEHAGPFTIPFPTNLLEGKQSSGLMIVSGHLCYLPLLPSKSDEKYHSLF
jgi:hypothetical protein